VWWFKKVYIVYLLFVLLNDLRKEEINKVLLRYDTSAIAKICLLTSI